MKTVMALNSVFRRGCLRRMARKDRNRARDALVLRGGGDLRKLMRMYAHPADTSQDVGLDIQPRLMTGRLGGTA